MSDELRDEYQFDYQQAKPNRFAGPADVPEVQTEEMIDPELRAELDRRIALADADPTRGVPWEEVRAAARKRWRGGSSEPRP